MRRSHVDDTLRKLRWIAGKRESTLQEPSERGKLQCQDDGVVVQEHSDTWGFAWMPAIEEFVEDASTRRTDDQRSSSAGGSVIDEREGRDVEHTPDTVRTPDRDDLTPRPGPASRKRARPSPSTKYQNSRRQPSYNETLLSDKSYHNPHALETMAAAFGIIRPLSFMVDVETDNTKWQSVNEPALRSAQLPAETATDSDAGEQTRCFEWFYDTVRDRQNRLWADARVRKGVELAKKGGHQAAIDIYTQALGMCPDHENGLVARGAAYASAGRLRQAVGDLSRALSMNPNNENASRYLVETRRRIDGQNTRSPPNAVSSTTDPSVSRTKQNLVGGATGSTLHNKRGQHSDSRLGGDLWAGDAAGNQAAKSSFGGLLHEEADQSSLRKIRALLEEDERRRKRERKEAGGSSGGEGRKKKARKKDKKSRRNSHRKKIRDHPKHSPSSDSDASSSDVQHRRKSKKEKSDHKRRRRKSKKKSRTRSVSPSAALRNGGLNGWDSGRRRSAAELSGMHTLSSSSSGSDGGFEVDADTSHPILQRKKHSLWG